MAKLSTHTPTELAHRSRDGTDVTLVWVQGDDEDKVVVRVCDRHLALDVYYHPFGCRDFSDVDHEDSRLAA
jgi:hypothetical protein